MLEKEDLTFNQRNCLLFRSGEKEILHFFIDLGDYVLKLFSMSFRLAKKETQNLPAKFDKNGGVRDYLHNIALPVMLK